MIHQYPAHFRSGYRIEMRAALPVYAVFIRQPEIGFVHQRGRLQSMIGPFAAHVPASAAAEFAIDQFHQAGLRIPISGPQAREQAGDLTRR